MHCVIKYENNLSCFTLCKMATLLSQRNIPSGHASRAVLVVDVGCSLSRVLAEIQQQYMSLSTKKECKPSVK